MQDEIAGVEVSEGGPIGFQIGVTYGGIVSEDNIGIVYSIFKGEDSIVVLEPVCEVSIQCGWGDYDFGIIEPSD